MPSLLYAANARVPSEKAHPYQILKMCEAFARQGTRTRLVLPRRVQPRAMRSIDLWEHYRLRPCFQIQKKSSLDLLWLLPPAWQRLAFYLQATSFLWPAVWQAHRRPFDFYYTRDWPWAFCLAHWPGRPPAGLYYEAHHFEARLNTSLRQGRVRGVVVLTSQLKRRYQEQGVAAEQIHVAPDGVDLTHFAIDLDQQKARTRLGLPQHAWIIGYVGQLHTMRMEKGVRELTDAFGMLKSQQNSQPCKLCLVGGRAQEVAPYRQRLAPAWRSDLIWVGQQPRQQIPYYLKAFDCCVMPFPWHPHYAYYMSPLKLFEYMAAGRPIVATQLPAVEEILHPQNAVLVAPGDAQALARGLRLIWRDRERAARLARQAYLDVQEYTWDKRARGILDFMARTRATCRGKVQ